MKKSILMLSALLALVVSIFCLQGCSSGFDDYVTEEYGYYTEDEITEIETLAKSYGLCLEMDNNYFGRKKSIKEYEEEFIAFSSVLGEYEMIPQKAANGEITYISKKKETSTNCRSTTRFIESDGEWSGSKENPTQKFTVNVKIEWKYNQYTGVRFTDEVSVTIKDTNNILSAHPASDYSSGSVTCIEQGYTGIYFYGNASYSLCTKYDKNATNPDDKIAYSTYRFTINRGHISTNGPISGSFSVLGGV